MGHQLWNDVVTWEDLSGRLADHGVRGVYIKYLSQNHNSKNQIAGLGSDLSRWNQLHLGPVQTRSGSSHKPRAGAPIFHSSVPWVWLGADGLVPARDTKLVYHPQYPEVRLSGFLAGTQGGHTVLLQYAESRGSRATEPGRILVFGPSADRNVYAAIVSQFSPAAAHLETLRQGKGHIVEVNLETDESTSKERLFEELRRVIDKQWIEPYRLYSNGSTRPCQGTNCHGITLESELGISSNGTAGPDFMDWEVKAHKVGHLRAHLSSRITLLTPSPDAGLAKERGALWVVQRYGMISGNGARLDLGGAHVSGQVHARSRLLFGVDGFDATEGMITAESGSVYWKDAATQEVVASWSFAKLLTHWQNKHSRSIFVPCVSRAEPSRAFRYGSHVHVGEGTSFLRFLNAVCNGTIILDPGLNAKLQPNGTWRAKTRYQFRAPLTKAGSLYKTFEPEIVSGAAFS